MFWVKLAPGLSVGFASNDNENYVQLDDGLFNKINNQEVRI